MKRWQIVLCVIAVAASVVAFWFVCSWLFQQVSLLALALVVLALMALAV